MEILTTLLICLILFLPIILAFIKKPWSFYSIISLTFIWLSVLLESYWYDKQFLRGFIALSGIVIFIFGYTLIVSIYAIVTRKKFLDSSNKKPSKFGNIQAYLVIIGVFIIWLAYFVIQQWIPLLSYKHCQYQVFPNIQVGISDPAEYRSSEKEAEFQKCMKEKGYPNWLNAPGYRVQ